MKQTLSSLSSQLSATAWGFVYTNNNNNNNYELFQKLSLKGPFLTNHTVVTHSGHSEHQCYYILFLLLTKFCFLSFILCSQLQPALNLQDWGTTMPSRKLLGRATWLSAPSRPTWTPLPAVAPPSSRSSRATWKRRTLEISVQKLHSWAFASFPMIAEKHPE